MDEPRLTEIYNYLRLTDRLATAGQPTAEQLAAVREAGYQTVINLAMPDSPQALPDEARVAEELGLEYVPIPVVWAAPQMEDLHRFFAAMDERAGQKVFVHCIANMRVSAFMYLYRVLHEGMDEEEAARDLHRIWQPDETWQTFIDSALRTERKAEA